MARAIHARRTSGEERRFRVWSTITNSYLTPELTESELRAWEREDAVREAIQRYERTINDRVRRAREIGTSSDLGDTRDLDAEWDEEQQ